MVDFIGIGAPRCGSTWIYQSLAVHPEICMSDPKETNFFMGTDIESLERYEWNFRQCADEPLRGEFSPRYLYSETAAENIKRCLPEAKLLVCLRNPIDRIESRINYTKAKGATRIEGVDAWNFIEKRSSFIDESRYAKHLQTFLDRFSREQFYIAFFEDMKKDPVAFMQEIYTFLGVDNTYVPTTATYVVNRAYDKQLASARFQRFARNMRTRATHNSIWRKGTPLLKTLGARSLYNAVTGFNEYLGALLRVEPPRILFTQAQRKALREELADDIAHLEDITGRDLSQWQ